MSEKTEKRSVSFPQTMLAAAEARAGGNFSGYLQRLVEQDMQGGATPNAMAPRILVELTREACGKPLAAEMERILGDRNQPLELKTILEGYIATNKGGIPEVTPAALDRFVKAMQQVLRDTSRPAKLQDPQGSHKK